MRTLSDTTGMSASCRKRTNALQQKRVTIRSHPADALWLVPTATHPASERRITRDGDAMHTPPLARIIVERGMLDAAVVPDRQRTNLPAESAGKLRLHGMRHQKIENRPRLGALEAFEAFACDCLCRALCGRSQDGCAQAGAWIPSAAPVACGV